VEAFGWRLELDEKVPVFIDPSEAEMKMQPEI